MLKNTSLTPARKHEIGYLLLKKNFGVNGVALDGNGVRKLLDTLHGTNVNPEELRAFMKEVVEELLCDMNK